MARTHAPDGASDTGTEATPSNGTGSNGNGSNGAGILSSDGTDFLPADGTADALRVVDSDVSTRPAEWMTRPPSGTKTYDYRLKGLDLGAELVAEPQGRAPQTKRAANRRVRRRLYIQWSIVLVVIALVIATLRVFVVEPVTINSNAMVPTLPSGTSVLVAKWSVLAGSTGRGDIVVFDEPRGSHCSPSDNESQHLIARVIGLPGQTVWSQRGRIVIDGHTLDERGWYNPPFGEVGPKAIPRTTVPAGSYYVLGDNRTDTCDSRAFGPIAGSLVVGKVVATVLRNGHPYLHSI